MSDWKSIESPRIKAPLELREMEPSRGGERAWEVQELRRGAMFKVTLHREQAKGSHASDAALEHAVCLAVEDALMSPPAKEPGETYDVGIAARHLAEAGRAS